MISAELLRNLLKSAAEFMKYFHGILENLPRKTGGTDVCCKAKVMESM